MPNTQDSIGWKNQRLIEQQQLFATRENQKRDQLIRQQQLFVAEQAANKERQSTNELEQWKNREAINILNQKWRCRMFFTALPTTWLVQM